MANYINRINVGGTLYDIGMQNAVHFHGISKVTNFYTTSACTIAAGDENIGDDLLYTKGLTLAGTTSATLIDEIMVGCMIILADESGASTQYEYVCTSIISGEGTANQIAEWSCMGEVKTTSGTIVTSIDQNTGDVATDVTVGKGDFVTSVSALGAASAIPSSATLATANYTVITADPETAAAHEVSVASQTVVTKTGNTSFNPVTNVSISDGKADAKNGTITTSVSQTPMTVDTMTIVTNVTGGSAVVSKSAFVTAAVGSISTATGSVVTGAVGSVTTATGSVVTGLADSNVVTSVTSAEGVIASVEGHTLNLAVSAVTALSHNTAVASALQSVGTIATSLSTSEAGTASILTSVSSEAASTASAVTSVEHTNVQTESGDVVIGVSGGVISNITGSVTTGVDYEKQSLTVSTLASDVTVITSATTGVVSVVNGLTEIAAVTNVPRASKPVATAFDSFTAVPVISNVSVSTAQAVNSITANTATITTSVTTHTGSVLTAAV